jgi:NAD(P)-dependent dehydrogenase (short-subunit alcohol dehydrogenase family)
MSEFDGQTIMVTGANGGLGVSVVQRFYEAGANLALVVRRASSLDDLFAELPGTVDQSRWLAVEADVTSVESMQAAVSEIDGRFGRIDALAHTVGGYAGGKPAHELDLEMWDKMMTLNARSVLITAGTVANYMVQKNSSGSIVVVLARNALDGKKNHVAYSASKAAAQRIVESMSKELLDGGIRVNGVIPGTIDTPANREATPDADFDRWVKPESIADVILFLCSSAADSISGDSIAVHGRS